MRRVRTFLEDYMPRLKERDGVRLRYDGVPLVVVERTYRLLTPLFGGGVEPRFADPVTTVRATEVRGQLRFWWRAIRGWQAQGSLERLFDLEAAIFGSAGEGGASPVVVEVEALAVGEEVSPYRDVSGKKFPQPVKEVAHPYLAFPLQRTRQDPRNYPVRQGVRFKLRLMYPEAVSTGKERLDLRQELEAALWAWETFGGIGARTRRGFGALAVEGSKAPTEVEIREGLRRFSREQGWPEGVPHLTPSSLVRVVPLSWREVAERYQAFRQARNTLKPQDKDLDRMASPLLFRPMEGKQCVVAVLEGPRVPPGGLVLEISSPFLKGEVDPVRAFVKSLQEV